MTFHNLVVGCNGQRQAMFLENVPGLAQRVLRNFDLVASPTTEIAVIELPDRPPIPKQQHRIGLIGGVGITTTHLKAYRKTGFEVVTFSDLNLDRVRLYWRT